MNMYIRALAAALLVAGCVTLANHYSRAEEYTVKVFSFDEDEHYVGYGSGFFVNSRMVVTAKHVVEGRSSYSVMKKSWWLPKPASLVYSHPTEDVAVLCTDKASTSFPAYLSEHSSMIEGKYYALGNSWRRDFDKFDCEVIGFNPKPPRHHCMRYEDGRIFGFSGGPLFDEDAIVYGSVVAQISEKNDLDKNVIAVIMPVETIQESVRQAVKSCQGD